MKFHKKPVVIDAWQWNETMTLLRELEHEGLRRTGYSGHVNTPDLCHALYISTLEGSLHVSLGDWIIKGVKGEFYPCKPDIFAATYERAEVEESRQPVEYWKSRAETAELKVLTFHEEIVKLREKPHPVARHMTETALDFEGEIEYMEKLRVAGWHAARLASPSRENKSEVEESRGQPEPPKNSLDK